MVMSISSAVGEHVADSEAVLRSLTRLTGARDRSELWESACCELLALVPGVHASIDQIDERAMATRGAWWPRGSAGDDTWREAYVALHANHLPDHPLFLHVLGYDGPLPSPPSSWGDHEIPDWFWESPLAQGFYVPQGIRDQLATRLPGPESVRTALVVARRTPGFTDRERADFALFAEMFASLDTVFARLERATSWPTVLLSEDWKHLMIDAAGTVVAATRNATLVGEAIGLTLERGASLIDTELWPVIEAEGSDYRVATVTTQVGEFDVRVQSRDHGRMAIFLRAARGESGGLEPRALVTPESYDLEDQERLLKAIRAIGLAETLEEFARSACRELLGLVPGVWASYNEMNLLSGRTAGIRWPHWDGAWERMRLPILIQRAHENPVVRHFAEEAETSTVTLGQLDPDCAFRRTELYRDFYAPYEIVDQAVFALPAPPGVVITMVVNRATMGFTPRELGLMDELRLHLSNLYRHVATTERARGLETVVLDEGWETILVNDEGTVVESTGAAIAIGHALGVALVPGASLAGTELWRGLVDTGERPRRFTTKDGSFDVSVVSGKPGPRVLLLRPAHSVTIESAMAQGLTRRQAEVGLLIVDGASNQQIASALGISPNTVRKHVESLLAVLGVQSRAAAAVALMRRRVG